MLFEIKRLELKHVPKIIRISQFVSEFVTTPDEDHWSAAELREWLSNPHDYCGGVFSDNDLIGYCLSHFHREVNKVHIENIFVRTDSRRLGLGTLLITALVEFYEVNATNKLRIAGLVQSDNQSAQQFFERLGFKRGYPFMWFEKDLLK